MPDNTRSSWDPFLYDLQGKVWEVFPTETVFLAELSGVGDPTKVGRFTRDMDTNREVFSGRRVRHTIITGGLNGGGFPSETSTWNVPHALSSAEVHITLSRTVVPFSVTVDIERDSLNNSSASAVAILTKQARIALARLENLAYLGDGTGLVGTITDSATSLATTITGGNVDVLLPGTVWDVLTRSNGADPGQGLRRKIASVVWTSDSAATVTWSTTQQASDGGSGSIVHASTEGIYIPGSYGNVAQGLEQAGAVTGTFEELDKAANPTWQGVDGRAGVSTVQMLSEQMLDGAVRVGRRSGLGVWDYALGDPAVIDGYKQSFYAQRHFDPQMITLKSGYSGVGYNGADQPMPLIKEPSMKKTALRFIQNDSFQVYGDQKGPSFLDDDGGMFRRFTRALPKEADLLDRHQLGVTKCNTIIKLDNLDVAA